MGIKKSLFSAGCGFNIDVDWELLVLPCPSRSNGSREAGPKLTSADHPLTCLVKIREGTFFFKKDDILCWRSPSETCSALGRYEWVPDDLKAGYWVCFIWEEACPLRPHYGLIIEFTPSRLPWAACKSNWIFLLRKQCQLVNSCIWMLSTLGYWMEISKNCTF